ncbi:zinc finger BED domain-containing protein RICESLEEPER 2-like [Cornus florida]|uniref:zinc finger BED domain-containing protein RICESLEEPER 2-like n=1 Tax=Cornus florida TaxID=4283 RepID=UPI002897D24E|nr:zinc finger BED domain-containing protein RICESLEEPER 2-like [Cornus florida]
MRCSAHILNLIVNHELNDIKDLITRIRGAVRYIKSSPQREQHFKACIKKEKIASKSVLCLDVQTRRSSTFFMLEAALELQKAFERLEEDDPHYKLELNNEPPSKSDWYDARVLAKFLQKFYNTALRLSGCLYATSNSYFQEVIGIECLLSECAKSSDTGLCSMALRMKSKFDMYCWNIEKMDSMLLVALVLDPCFKMEYVKFCCTKLHPLHKVDELMHRVKEAMSRIFAKYQLYDSINSASASSTQKSNGMAVDGPFREACEPEDSLLSRYRKYLKAKKVGSCKSEVDRYLEESCEECGPNFEILSWWKLNCSRYRVLAQVAKDVLAIPVSTIATESTFCTGGRPSSWSA